MISINKVGFSLFCGFFSIVGCGKDAGDFKPGAPDTSVTAASTGSPVISFAVTTASGLPECNATRLGSLGYVRDEKKFYTCESIGWTVEQISTGTTNQTGKISERWKFHVDSFTGEPELSEDILMTAAKLGDVSLVKFSDGTAWFFISGRAMEVSSDPVEDVTAHTHLYTENFSYSGFFDSTKGEFSKIFKFSAWTNTRLRIKINMSAGTPTLKAAIDVDGNFANNAEYSFTMMPE